MYPICLTCLLRVPVLRAVEFSEAEREVYLRVHAEVKAEFERYVAGGSSHVSGNLLAIMSLLNPLRAICSGGALREEVGALAWTPRFFGLHAPCLMYMICRAYRA